MDRKKDDKIKITRKINRVLRERLYVTINIHHPPDYSSVPQDNLILEHYGINELNFESIKKYREKFSDLKPNHPWNGLEIKEFLYKIGAWGKVRNTNEEGLTLAGLLMFSEERIITEVLPQYFLEYRESLEKTIDESWSKRFTSQDGTWSGNLFDFYFKVSVNLTNADYFSQTDHNMTICFYESLVNALAHADYYGEGGIVIEKERDLLRFSNPGLFRISVEQALEGNISNLRNPNLFKMFILIGLCKRTGSSLKHIKTSWETTYHNAFELIQDTDSKRTILTLHVKQNAWKEDAEKVTKSDIILFPEEDELMMSNFDEMESSYNKENDFSNSLNNGDNSYNKQINSMNNEDNSINSEKNSVNKENNSYNNEMNSLNNGDNSSNNEFDFSNSYNSEESVKMGEKEDKIDIHLTNKEEEEVNEISEKEIEEKLWEISELARRKKRLSPAIMEDIILKLCAQKTLMLRELAVLLERTPDGLRNNYLAKLLDKGKIRLKYPDQVNHPKQAYIIVKK